MTCSLPNSFCHPVRRECPPTWMQALLSVAFSHGFSIGSSRRPSNPGWNRSVVLKRQPAMGITAETHAVTAAFGTDFRHNLCTKLWRSACTMPLAGYN